MEKIIIFCKRAVETLTYFSEQIAHAFEAWGYEIFWLDFQMLGLGAWKLRQAVQGKEAVLITFNFIGLSGEEELWELDDTGTPMRSIWDELDILCLNMMVDHPIYYYQALQHPVSRMKAFCVDRDHVAYIKRFYPGVECSFLPLAGNLLSGKGVFEETLEQWRKRPYSLVFTANYVPVSNIENQLKNLDPEYRDFYYEIMNAFVQNPKQDLLSCMEGFLRREIPDISDAQLCEAMSAMPAVDLWIRTYFREKTVRVLAEGGIKIYVFGKDWEQMPCKRQENLVSVGHMVDSAACVQAVKDGKIALNTMPWFKDGAHDRIFTAMLQGAAALTDESVYLREQFEDQETILYYDLCKLEQLPQQVTKLLQEPERLFALCNRSAAIAERLHTWEHRAKVLKDCF